MPELPEVETIARRLREHGPGPGNPGGIIGKSVREVHVLWERTIAEPDVDSFKKRLVGQKILSTGRRGKYLLIELNRDWLLIHLRMSGDMVVGDAFEPLATHDRLILELDGGVRLAFNDTRKFGRVWLVDHPDRVVGGLGPEPLDSELTGDEFSAMLASHRRQIKPLLLDQTFLAGVGNIYADEALFQAGIHPQARASGISSEDADRLLKAIRDVLSEGIRRNGASIDWVYRGGGFQNQFYVYQRAGEDCRRCGAEIQRIVVAQRGTHFCPDCQKG